MGNWVRWVNRAFDGAGRAAQGGVMSTVLTAEEIAAGLTTLQGWRYEAVGAGGALAKTFLFPTFRDALAFMVRAGFEAEAMDHHPEWTNVYHRVAVRLNTHDAGGRVTGKDLELALRMEEVAAGGFVVAKGR